jgi:hypothetical protein
MNELLLVKYWCQSHDLHSQSTHSIQDQELIALLDFSYYYMTITAKLV